MTVCKQPHCVTHCQAPKPECEPVCEEPKCDWKCTKPACPKPKCELVCENPSCVPKVDCCSCGSNAVPLAASPFPFFKESESNKNCCSCGKDNTSKSNLPNFKQVVEIVNPALTNTMPSSAVIQKGNHLLKVENKANIEMLKTPVPLGTPQLTDAHAPLTPGFSAYKASINIDKIHKDAMTQ